MATHYEYVCRQCGRRERRYRNATRCRKCGGELSRIEPPIKDKDAIIAALLAACKEWVTWAETEVTEYTDGSMELPPVTAVLADTRAAIAQAEGGP